MSMLATMGSPFKASAKPTSSISSPTFPNSHIALLPTTTIPTTHHARTSRQWISGLESIKLLYLQRKYKQCVARCMEVMDGVKTMSRKKEIHPVYKTCVTFYTAISHEVLGRAAHQYSSNKLPLLRDALEGFVSCQKNLEDAVVVVDGNNQGMGMGDDWVESDRGHDAEADADTDAETETTGSLMNSITRIIESSLICATQDDPFVSDNEHQGQGPGKGKGKGIKSKAEAKKKSRREDDGEGDDHDHDHDHLLVPPLRVSSQNKDRLHPSPLKIRKISVPVMLSGEENEPATAAAAAAAAEARRTCSSPPNFDLDVCGRGGRQTLARLHCPPRSPLTLVPPDTAILNLNARGRGRGKGRASETRAKTTKIAHPEHSSQTQTPSMSEEQMRHIIRFNNIIASLRDQIASSILAVQTLIDEVKEIQRLHRAAVMSGSAVSTWSFSPLILMSRSHATTPSTNSQPRMYVLGAKETKEQRIVRLRAEGWNTVGIKSKRRGWKGAEYYRAFCGAVLDELYLER